MIVEAPTLRLQACTGRRQTQMANSSTGSAMMRPLNLRVAHRQFAGGLVISHGCLAFVHSRCVWLLKIAKAGIHCSNHSLFFSTCIHGEYLTSSGFIKPSNGFVLWRSSMPSTGTSPRSPLHFCFFYGLDLKDIRLMIRFPSLVAWKLTSYCWSTELPRKIDFNWQLFSHNRT